MSCLPCTHSIKNLLTQGVLQGVAFTGVQFLREKRLISLHEKRVRKPSASQALAWAGLYSLSF